jgi:hypothetical protein
MFRIKTPHAAPLAHMLRMFGYFLYSSALIGILLQKSPSVPGISTVASLLVTASLSLVLGLLVTIVIRWLATLTQTGRVLQYASFWLGSYSAVLIATAVFPGAIWHYPPSPESLLIVVLAFGGATYLKEVPWKGRTWLPVAKKQKGKSRVFTFLNRAWLRTKAEILDGFGSERRSRLAWQNLVNFEELHLPGQSSGRSFALMQLARSYIDGQRDHHVFAKGLLDTAYENIVKDKGETHRLAADALQMQGQVEYGLGNRNESLRLHQEAEVIYLEKSPLSIERARNLQDLSRAYNRLGDWKNADWCSREATGIRSILLLSGRMTGGWR